MLAKLKRGEPVLYNDIGLDDGGGGGGGDANGGWGAGGGEVVAAERAGSNRIAVNQQNLKRAWEASHRATREDWSDWLRRFSVELLRESPSPALRSCAGLSQVYHAANPCCS